MGTEDKISEILERVVRVETKIDGYNHLRDKLDETYGRSKQNQKDVAEMKDNQKWLWRTVAGSIIALIVGLLWNWKGVG